jgi:uroporphyrinogen-III synthase
MSASSARNLVLITRPAADADAFANDVTSLGLTPLIEPMLGIVPMPYEMPDLKAYPAIVFTSANAVRVFGCPADNRDILIFAVGSHTADEARKAGYARIISAEGDGADLAAIIRKKLETSERRVLHIRGEHTAMPLETLLVKDHIKVDTLAVYTAKTEDEFSPVCHAALTKGDIGTVTFFSKRTAENFIKLIEKEGLSGKLSSVRVLCISPAVLECVRNVSWREAYSAETPDRASMIDLLKGVCQSR